MPIPNAILQTMLPPAHLTPEQAMTYLASLHKQAWTARLKAYDQGLQAIHDQIVAYQKQIEVLQAQLLEQHPELILMAFQP